MTYKNFNKDIYLKECLKKRLLPFVRCHKGSVLGQYKGKINASDPENNNSLNKSGPNRKISFLNIYKLLRRFKCKLSQNSNLNK